MKKIIAGGIFLFIALTASFAGDAAVLVDSGFSADGAYYIFGQYGKTDKSFQGWAEIYTVDVAGNDYVDGGVFRVKPSAVTFNKNGKEVFDSLAGQNFNAIKKYGCNPAKPDQVLYIREDEKKSSLDEIVFKDFEGISDVSGILYHVRLVPSFNGSGKNCRSKFFIEVLKKDSSGNTVSSFAVGTPDFERKGIVAYQIERIFADKSGKSLVFVVKKTLEDETGTSIRYMVETYRIK